MPYCQNCGEEIKDLSQNFCEKCGSPITNIESQSETVLTSVTTPSAGPSSRQAYHSPGSLFDINRNYYILKEKC